jgi:hypothetical protein
MSDKMNIQNDKSKSESNKPITSKGYAFLAIWTLIAIFVSILDGYAIISMIHQMKLEESADYQMEASNAYINYKNDSFHDASMLLDSKDVLVGIYVIDIRELNIKDFRWIADFYIWFVWNGKEISPGDHFQVINGYVGEDDKDFQFTRQFGPNNMSHYEQYEVVASIVENFDTRLYPFDTQYLTIKIEDVCDDIKSLKYIGDRHNSTVSDHLNNTAIKIIGHPQAVVRSVEYKTSFGDPFETKSNSTYSQFSFIIPIQRNNPFYLFLKLFQGLIVAVFVSMLAFFIKPTWVDPRFGLGIGGLFAAVANNYIVTSSLPVAGIVTVTGLIHGIGITIIFFTLVQSVLSLHIYDDLNERSLSELFDRISFLLFSIIFIALIITIIMNSL